MCVGTRQRTEAFAKRFRVERGTRQRTGDVLRHDYTKLYSLPINSQRGGCTVWKRLNHAMKRSNRRRLLHNRVMVTKGLIDLRINRTGTYPLQFLSLNRAREEQVYGLLLNMCNGRIIHNLSWRVCLIYDKHMMGYIFFHKSRIEQRWRMRCGRRIVDLYLLIGLGHDNDLCSNDLTLVTERWDLPTD